MFLCCIQTTNSKNCYQELVSRPMHIECNQLEIIFRTNLNPEQWLIVITWPYETGDRVHTWSNREQECSDMETECDSPDTGPPLPATLSSIVIRVSYVSAAENISTPHHRGIFTNTILFTFYHFFRHENVTFCWLFDVTRVCRVADLFSWWLSYHNEMIQPG